MGTGRRIARFARALVLLSVVCVAVPQALIAVARARFGGASPLQGIPLPTDWEPDRIRSALTDRLSDETIADVAIRSALLVAWMSVAVVVVTVLAEAIHMVRHHGLPMPDVRGLGMSQQLARAIAAGLLVVVPTLSSPLRTAAREGPTPLPVRAGAAVVDAGGRIGPAARPDVGPHAQVGAGVAAGAAARGMPQVGSAAAPAAARGRHVVRPGESVMGIAHRMAGPDTSAVTEYADRLLDLNLGRDMGDGQRFTNAAFIDVGWVLVLPAEDVSPTASAAAASSRDGVHVVEPCESLWSIADEELGDPRRWPEIYEMNQGHEFDDGRSLHDPDLIRPGWPLRFPAPAGGHEPEVGRDADVGDVARTPAVDPGPAPPNPPRAPIAPAARPPVDRVDDPAVVGGGERPGPVNVWPDLDERPPERSTRSAPARSDGGRADVEAVSAVDGDAAAGRLLPFGGAAMLSAGVLALLAVRRRRRLRGASPRARLPEPIADHGSIERELRSTDVGERLVRVQTAVRAVAESLIAADERVLAVLIGNDGGLELRVSGPARLPEPWEPDGEAWRLPGTVPIELLADAAVGVGQPCPTLTQIGRSDDGREVFVDLEAIEAIEVGGDQRSADAIVAAVAATLASSVLAEVTTLVGVGVPDGAFLGHRLHVPVDDIGPALEAAHRAIGTTASQDRSSYELRARASSGEAWEPAVVLVGSGVGTFAPPAARTGLAIVSASPIHGASSRLAPDGDMWSLQPLGIRLVPIGLGPNDVLAVARLVDVPDLDPDPVPPIPLDDDLTLAPRTDDLADAGLPEPPSPVATSERPWSLLVCVLGPVDVVSRSGDAVAFERSKTRELVAWLATHRDRSTRTAARTALWEQDVRDSTFANVVSEARRALARLVEPPDGNEWVGRTMTEALPLHELVRTDADLVAAALETARVQPPDQAIATLAPAVARITGLPFEGTSYLWPDAEGLTSELVLLATSAATELAAHCLSVGDIDGVFSATGRGLRVLPGHEELIALRMRAHARFGDRAGVRHEWESYERVINGDPWSDGEASPRLLDLRRRLLDPSQ